MGATSILDCPHASIAFALESVFCRPLPICTIVLNNTLSLWRMRTTVVIFNTPINERDVNSGKSTSCGLERQAIQTAAIFWV